MKRVNLLLSINTTPQVSIFKVFFKQLKLLYLTHATPKWKQLWASEIFFYLLMENSCEKLTFHLLCFSHFQFLRKCSNKNCYLLSLIFSIFMIKNYFHNEFSSRFAIVPSIYEICQPLSLQFLFVSSSTIYTIDSADVFGGPCIM